jgi:hypothetical protein
MPHSDDVNLWPNNKTRFSALAGVLGPYIEGMWAKGWNPPLAIVDTDYIIIIIIIIFSFGE